MTATAGRQDVSVPLVKSFSTLFSRLQLSRDLSPPRSPQLSAMTADETTPLISNGDASTSKKKNLGPISRWRASLNVEHRILLAGFLITLSFSFTQVP